MEKLSFSLKFEEVEVELIDVDGNKHACVMRGLDGAGRDSYLDNMGGRMKFNAAGKTEGLTDYKNLQSGLLTLCLFDENNKNIPLSVLQKYPATVLESLFKAAQELSGLDKGAEADAKNE